MQTKACNAIMQAAEEYLEEAYKNANKFTVHDKRDTLMVEDMQKAISEQLPHQREFFKKKD